MKFHRKEKGALFVCRFVGQIFEYVGESVSGLVIRPKILWVSLLESFPLPTPQNHQNDGEDTSHLSPLGLIGLGAFTYHMYGWD
jgi:hypothetical protein